MFLFFNLLILTHGHVFLLTFREEGRWGEGGEREGNID